MKKHFLYLLTLGLLLMIGCQKEVSFEAGKNLSHGSLQSDGSGDCLPKTVSGAYVALIALVPATNTITVDVDVTKAGSYTVASDTVNGYYFRATGTFATPGINTIILKGSGTPLSAGTNNFVISYDSSICDIAVTVLPSGAGGPAAFTLTGSPGNCTSTVKGVYTLNTALTSANKVDISVNVATVGTYTISTTATGGMTFSATGTFATTGVQTVTLAGAGTPTTAGNNTIPVTAGASSCSFVVNVVGPAVGTLGGTPGICTSSVINGTYTVGNVLTTSNTVQVQVNVASPGGYTISTNTVTGFSFTVSGTFAAVGIQNVILNGTGTPTTAGPQTFTVTFGSSSCTFVVNVVAATVADYFPRTTNSNWSYEFNDVATDSLLIKVISNTLNAGANTYNIFMENGGSGFDSSGYYRKSGNDYYHYTNLTDYLYFDNNQWVEFNFLKDNQAAGFTWTTPSYTGSIGGTAITMHIKFTVLQKDVPVSVTTSAGTVSYPNTIVVEEKYEAFSGGGWVSLDNIFGYYKDYYSRNIGWIQEEYFDASGLSGTFKMRRYVVY